jgi:epoxyqueuosine reductase
VEITARILNRARQLGFDAAGVTAVESLDPAPLHAWLDAGYGAEMDYLTRHLPLRADLRQVLPGAQSVVVVAMSYPGPTDGEAEIGWVARYARGADYHDVIRERLDTLWAEITAEHPDAEGRIFVDGGPLPERELARRAGIGWPGAHSCLIHPRLGSRFVLGEILTTLPLEPSDPACGSCGSCFRCMDACPTGAIVAAGTVNARRCLSYLTIEHKGSVPVELRPLVGTRIFGCDTCQDVCPYNRGVGETDYFPPSADLLAPDLLALLALTPEAFNTRFRGTPIHRLKRRGLLRNVCVALGNLGELAALPGLRKMLADEEELIREHAQWAIAQFA